jgi:hypothetical protein
MSRDREQTSPNGGRHGARSLPTRQPIIADGCEQYEDQPRRGSGPDKRHDLGRIERWVKNDSERTKGSTQHERLPKAPRLRQVHYHPPVVPCRNFTARRRNTHAPAVSALRCRTNDSVLLCAEDVAGTRRSDPSGDAGPIFTSPRTSVPPLRPRPSPATQRAPEPGLICCTRPSRLGRTSGCCKTLVGWSRWVHQRAAGEPRRVWGSVLAAAPF